MTAIGDHGKPFLHRKTRSEAARECWSCNDGHVIFVLRMHQSGDGLPMLQNNFSNVPLSIAGIVTEGDCL
jgi:hypothetical protein